MFEWILLPEGWIALLTLLALEIVLGIDNIIFISILVGRLPEAQRDKARRLGLLGAMFTRLLLLASIAWVIGLTEPWFTVLDNAISGRDVVLLLGGLFLLIKSTHEIHNSLELEEEHEVNFKPHGFAAVIIQIMLLDIVFSLDSVITAVGLVDYISIMVIAILLSVAVMMLAAGPIGRFVDANPSLKMLALSFLILVGVTLIAEGFDMHIPRGYIYFAMMFSVAVELLNMRLRGKRAKVKLQRRLS